MGSSWELWWWPGKLRILFQGPEGAANAPLENMLLVGATAMFGLRGSGRGGGPGGWTFGFGGPEGALGTQVVTFGLLGRTSGDAPGLR